MPITPDADLDDNVSINWNDSNGSVNTDGFHRPIFSSKRNVFEYSFRYTNDPTVWDISTTGSATETLNTDTAQVRLRTTTASGDEAIKQSFRYIHYVPGNSLTVYMTVNFNIDDSNCRRRVGYFDDLDGVFFEHDGTNFKVVRRTSTSGSAVDNSTPQSSFNIDKLNGTGYSGKTLDLTKQNIFVMDIAWLGSGRIRYGIDFGDKLVWFHQDNVANTITTPSMQSGTLPVRYEIKNNAAVSANQDLFLTCVAVMTSPQSESIILGNQIPINTGTNEISINTTETYIASVRLNPTYNRASAKPLEFRLLSTSGTKAVVWRIRYNSTLTGANWGNLGNILQSDGIASFSGGTIKGSGYIETSGSVSTTVNLAKNINLYTGRDIAGNSTTLTLTAQTLGGNSKILMSGLFLEIV